MDASIPAVPHLSPSLTASVNSVSSSSIPSPSEGVSIDQSQLSNAKSPADNSPFPRPGVRRISLTDSSIHPLSSDSHTSSSTFSRLQSVRDRTISAQQKMFTRFRPYNPRGVASPLELRFTARSLGFSSHIGLTLDDVQKGKEHFLAGLSSIPERLLRKAYQAKRADRDSAAQRLAVTLAEIESAERRRDYLFAVREDRAAGLTISNAQLELLEKLMDHRNLEDTEDDGSFHRAVYADELIALSIANGQITQMQEAMLSRSIPSVGETSILDGDDQEKEHEDEDEDEYITDTYVELPSSDPRSELDNL